MGRGEEVLGEKEEYWLIPRNERNILEFTLLEEPIGKSIQRPSDILGAWLANQTISIVG